MTRRAALPGFNPAALAVGLAAAFVLIVFGAVVVSRFDPQVRKAAELRESIRAASGAPR